MGSCLPSENLKIGVGTAFKIHSVGFTVAAGRVGEPVLPRAAACLRARFLSRLCQRGTALFIYHFRFDGCSALNCCSCPQAKKGSVSARLAPEFGVPIQGLGL